MHVSRICLVKYYVYTFMCAKPVTWARLPSVITALLKVARPSLIVPVAITALLKVARPSLIMPAAITALLKVAIGPA